MKLIVKDDYKELSRLAASLIQDEIQNKPNLVLGLATGSTPEGMYKELIRLHREEGLDFSQLTTFNLDEYLGIDQDHPNSYHYYMGEIFFNHINIKAENTHIPDGRADKPEEYCREYDRLIAEKGGIDLQILGIGENGHIAFNEPGRELNAPTSIVALTESTIEANSRFFDSIDQVPKSAITMGIGSIMKAKKIILLANGKNKAPIIKELLNTDKISTELPASMLLVHPDVTIIIDREAYEG